MADKVQGTFLSQKIYRVRWKPEELSDSNYFVTGSWDDEINKVVLWKYPVAADQYPVKAASLSQHGDVTELRFIDKRKIVLSSSLGFVKVVELDFDEEENVKFKELVTWEKLHYFNSGSTSSCTGVANFEEDLASVGEDGRINLLTARRKEPVRKIDEADSCSLRCVCFLKHNEIVTGNLRGHMKVWDLKSNSDKAASTFTLSGEQIGASCATFHPNQRHMLLTGGDDGSLTVWDMRHHTFPVTLLSAHSDSVNELTFHPDRPEHLFSCSASGQVWHWNTAGTARGARFSSYSDMSMDENPWLSSDAAKHRIEVRSAMPQVHKPINSLDVNNCRLICGCDNEAVYIINNVVM